MTSDRLTAFEMALAGKLCVLRRLEHGWTVDLNEGLALVIETPWRIVDQSRIAVTSEDDGHRFGRDVPFDSQDEANALLQGRTVTEASVDRVTADLTLWFGHEIRLDVFNSSSGYEGWQATCALDGSRWTAVAQGGGCVRIVSGQALGDSGRVIGGCYDFRYRTVADDSQRVLVSL